MTPDDAYQVLVSINGELVAGAIVLWILILACAIALFRIAARADAEAEQEARAHPWEPSRFVDWSARPEWDDPRGPGDGLGRWP